MSLRLQQYQDIQNVAKEYLRTPFEFFANERSLIQFACAHCKNIYHTTAVLYKDGDQYCSDQHKQLSGYGNSEWTSMMSQFKEVHDNYYSYTPHNNPDMVNVHCPKHGILEMDVSEHWNGKGCSRCLIETFNEENDVTDFVNAAHQIHDFRYRYDHIESLPNDDHINIECPKHGSFHTTTIQHLNGEGCPVCEQNHNQIRSLFPLLKAHNLLYALDKSFDGCISEEGRLLRFDLYIPQKHLCIEFDNKHHFEPIKYHTDTTDDMAEKYYQIQVQNDQIKSDYCFKNNINLIRIPYNRYSLQSIVAYINKLPNKRFIYTWDCFATDIHNITSYIKTFGYSQFAIYGVARGGLPFSVHISNHFGDICQHGIIHFQRYDGNDKIAQVIMEHTNKEIPIFIIDDLISSGITMTQVVNVLREKNPNAQIHPIVIFGAHNAHNIFFIRQHPRQWIVFPYEI